MKTLRELALASRLKILSENLSADVGKIYKEQNLYFEPRWFLVFYQLTIKTDMAITEIANSVGVTHPAVNQVVNEMIEAEIIETYTDKSDKRKRIVRLTEKGVGLANNIKPVWNDIENANIELIQSTVPDFFASIDKLEKALEEKSIYKRIVEKTQKRFNENIEIIEYNPRYKEYFKELNYEWLEKYFSIENSDAKILSDPENQILKKGGFIWFAKYGEDIVGTCSLIKSDDNSYELSKMAVTEKMQKKQIGKQLAIAAIEKARTQNASYIFLITHEKLIAAVNLYRQLGFEKLISLKDMDYERKGFTMKLNLNY